MPETPADDPDAALERFDGDDREEVPLPVVGWLGAIGQMVAAVLVVVAVVALLIGAAVAFRRLLP